MPVGLKAAGGREEPAVALRVVTPVEAQAASLEGRPVVEAQVARRAVTPVEVLEGWPVEAQPARRVEARVARRAVPPVEVPGPARVGPLVEAQAGRRVETRAEALAAPVEGHSQAC